MRQALAARWFDDFRVGERFALPRRVLTPNILRAFAEATGHAPELRHNPEDSEAIGYHSMLGHGFLATLQTVAGPGVLPFLIEESLIRLVDQTSRYIRPATDGDTLIPILHVVELEPNSNNTGIVSLRSTIHNQCKALILEGHQRWLLRTRPLH